MDKSASKFRDYTIDKDDPLKERVRQTYRQMHLNQTVDFVKGTTQKLFTTWRDFFFVISESRNRSDNPAKVRLIVMYFSD